MIMIISFIFIFFGGLILLREISKLINCKSITSAKVVDVYKKVDNESNGKTEIFLYPTFEYEVMGSKCVVKSDSGSKKCKYNIGDQVEIKYNANKPEKFYIKGDNSSLIAGLLLLFAGIVILVASFYR